MSNNFQLRRMSRDGICLSWSKDGRERTALGAYSSHREYSNNGRDYQDGVGVEKGDLRSEIRR